MQAKRAKIKKKKIDIFPPILGKLRSDYLFSFEKRPIYFQHFQGQNICFQKVPAPPPQYQMVIPLPPLRTYLKKIQLYGPKKRFPCMHTVTLTMSRDLRVKVTVYCIDKKDICAEYQSSTVIFHDATVWKYHDTKFSCNSAMTLNIELWPCFKVMKTCLVRRSFYVMHENATMTSVTKIQHKSLPWPWPFSPELVSRLMVTALYRRNTCTCTNIKIFAKIQPGHEISMCLKYCSTARRTLIMHGLDVVNLGLTSWHINIDYIHND